MPDVTSLPNGYGRNRTQTASDVSSRNGRNTRRRINRAGNFVVGDALERQSQRPESSISSSPRERSLGSTIESPLARRGFLQANVPPDSDLSWLRMDEELEQAAREYTPSLVLPTNVTSRAHSVRSRRRSSNVSRSVSNATLTSRESSPSNSSVSSASTARRDPANEMSPGSTSNSNTSSQNSPSPSGSLRDPSPERPLSPTPSLDTLNDLARRVLPGNSIRLTSENSISIPSHLEYPDRNPHIRDFLNSNVNPKFLYRSFINGESARFSFTSDIGNVTQRSGQGLQAQENSYTITRLNDCDRTVTVEEGMMVPNTNDAVRNRVRDLRAILIKSTKIHY